MEQFLAGLDDLLTKLAQAQDSETIRNATSILNTQYYASADCVPALVEIISRSPHFQVRQLAAVELRKRITKWWPQIQEALKVNLRSQLLSIALNEQNETVRHSIARVISSVASIDMPDEKWPTLLNFLQESCASQNAAHREVGIYCLYTLFEVIADLFMNNTASLFQLFNKLIVDAESKSVRITTVLVLGKLSEFVDSEDKSTIKMFRAILPNMVNVLEQCIKDGDEENAAKIFEVFDTMLMLDAPLLSEHLANLIDFFLTIGANTELDDSIRVFALSFLMWAAVYKQNKIRHLKLVGHIVERLMPIGTEEDPEDIDEDSASRLSYKVLNALATNIPPQQVFPIVMPFVLNYIQNPNPNYRKASMMAFAVTVEGCTDIIANKLNELLPLVCTGLQDSEIIVRRAACMALGCLAEEMPADISEHHQVLLPLVFNLMNDNNPEVTKHACNALDAILEGLGSDIVQYLQLLMEKLLFLLDNGVETETRATVIAAIGSAAHAAGEVFHPYFNQVLPRIVQFMSLKESSDDQMLRGVATDTIGSIAEAVGADIFRPYVQNLMALAVEQLHLDSPSLRECSFALFSNLARVFGEEFAPYLPTIVPEILKSCKAEEKNETVLDEEVDLTTGDMDDDIDEDFENFNFNSAIADEKEFAVDALGELFANTKSHFLPYIEESLVELQKLAAHLYDNVRKCAIQSMFTFLKTFYTMSNPVPWTVGVSATYPVHDNIKSLASTVIPMTLELWKEEDDRSVVAQICQEFVTALRLMGPFIVSGCLEDVAQILLEIFQKKSLCQQTFDDGDYEEEDDEIESESLLITSAGDLVAALCETVGPNFAKYFEVYMPLMIKYYKPTKTQSERSMAIGCLGECIAGIKSAVTSYTERLLPIFVKACGDEDELVRSNAAFALGCLTLHTQIDLSPHYGQLLTALSPLFSNQTLPNTVDNAAGAVARLILAHPEAVPLDQVLPTFVNALPLKADYEENQPVFDCIFQLFSTNNAFVLGHLPQFLHIFTLVLADNEQLKENTRNHLIELIRHLNAQSPELNIASSDLARFL
ncbi:armadillo-type protein [Cokeromyces recurvatus]|uniref:armadillo-type protein n=1 Tax=Cokeromyces recurvatus TaxID=90255 RepID=UPI00221E61F3|nr:armadillo-type protein [Cokeromyces recurvatus]KAI7907017.1 armadillo-type protein [Cokeromyces recurvatus]